LRILITGACGFVGRHLAQQLLDTTPDAEIHGTILPDLPYQEQQGVKVHSIDLKNALQTAQLLADLRPQHIYHLAAQAFVPRSFENPWETLENNILAQLNVILACLETKITPRMLVVSSAEIYGPVTPEELPINEDARLRPNSPYSVSKITQDMLGLQYYLSHNLPIMRARAFNHLGPGQNERFVAPDFGMQIARIEAGLQPQSIKVGDLKARRDFTDVRDIVRAYQMIVENGTPGEVYNVCSGQARSVQSLLDIMLQYSHTSIQVIVDTARLRPANIPDLRGDNTRLTKATGWQPKVPFEQTLVDVLNDCRQRIHLTNSPLN